MRCGRADENAPDGVEETRCLRLGRYAPGGTGWARRRSPDRNAPERMRETCQRKHSKKNAPERMKETH